MSSFDQKNLLCGPPEAGSIRVVFGGRPRRPMSFKQSLNVVTQNVDWPVAFHRPLLNSPVHIGCELPPQSLPLQKELARLSDGPSLGGGEAFFHRAGSLKLR